MSLRNKIAITIIPILLIAIICINLAFGLFFQKFILTLEDSQVSLTKENISSYAQEKKSKYIGTANDWGHWDDTYQFVNGSFADYVSLNLPESTFQNLDLSFMIYQGEDESIFFKQYYDFDLKAFSDFPAGFFDNFQAVVQYAKNQDDAFGVFELGGSFYLAASTDITDSAIIKQPSGKLIIGRRIDDKIYQDIEKISGCTISGIQVVEWRPNNILDDVVILDSAGINETKDAISIKLVVPNAYDTHSGTMITLAMPRSFYIMGVKSAAVFSIINTAGSIIIGLLIFILLGKYLTKPFVALIKDVKQIDMAKREFVKLPEEGDGEFSYLRKTINQLLEQIEAGYLEIIGQQEKLQATLHSVGDGVITTDINGNIQFMNPVAQKLTGWKLDDALNVPIDQVFVIINEYTRDSVESPVKLVFEKEEIVELANHTLLLSKHGNEVPIEDTAAPIRDLYGNIIGCVLVFRDFSERKEKQRWIEYLSYHDQLTGLYNRRFFDEELKRADVPENLPLSFVYADVNGLKTINDAFGHQAGDEMIQKVAEAMKQECRPGDMIARTGGDEFVLLLPKTDEASTRELLEKVKEKILSIKFMGIGISIAFGWAMKQNQTQNASDVIKRAEDYMYHKKIFHSSCKRNIAINSILQALLEKNPMEREHALGVGKLCEAIGKACSLSEEEILEVRAAGEMHDIGKIAVEDAILFKQGTLSESEWAQIKRHPETGYRLLGSSNEYYQISEFVLSHHERWDGKGYPRGLHGESIPWKARVIALADAYDAMIHDRPYRKALSAQEAAREIRGNAGTQFDPEIARIFVEKVLNLPW